MERALVIQDFVKAEKEREAIYLSCFKWDKRYQEKKHYGLMFDILVASYGLETAKEIWRDITNNEILI